MINSNGEAVGVLSFKIGNSENLNFVVPINYARGLLALPGSYTLSEVREELVGFGDVFEKTEESSEFPTRWKSLASGTLKILRIEGDYLYVETILPKEKQQYYQLLAAELKKEGEVYVGVLRRRFNCWNSWGGRWKNCADETAIEITLLSPTRIEGWIMRPPDSAKFNYRKCKHSKKFIRRSFTWIPEKQP